MPLKPRRTDEQTEFARQLRATGPIPERVLWNVLRNRQVAGLRFRRQVPVGPYCVDFICSSAKLVVELDGMSHERRQRHDAERTEYLNEQGLRVFRVTNDEVLDDVESVAIAIAREAGIDVVAWLNGRWSPPGRDCECESNVDRKTPSRYPTPPKTGERGQGKSQDQDSNNNLNRRFCGLLV